MNGRVKTYGGELGKTMQGLLHQYRAADIYCSENRKASISGVWTTRIQILVPQLTNYLILDKILNLSLPQLPHNNMGILILCSTQCCHAMKLVHV